jgi:DNA-directed RNA polymerase beta' subunit
MIIRVVIGIYYIYSIHSMASSSTKPKTGSKRKLRPKEIEKLVSFVNGRQPTKELEDAYSNRIKDDLRKQLREVYVYPSVIPKLAQELISMYHKTLVSYGEAVGLLASESVGEQATQMTLNTFHFSGTDVKAVTQGVPRCSELISASNDPKAPRNTIYFKAHNTSIKELRESIGNSLRDMSINDLCKDRTYHSEAPSKKWYDVYEVLYEDSRFRSYEACISYKINMVKSYRCRVTLEDIALKISRLYGDVLAIWSPDEIGEVDVFVQTAGVDTTTIATEGEAVRTYLEKVVYPNLQKISLFGVPGIKDFYIKKSDTEEWIVDTVGCNLPEIMAHELVDPSRCTTSHTWEVYNTLGLEATRSFIIDELMDVMSSGGYTCSRHAELLVDYMLMTGTIMSISRFSMRTNESGPIAKASFEETLENFIGSAVKCQTDSTRGLSASVVCGKTAKIGTRSFSILPKEESFVGDNKVNYPEGYELTSESGDDEVELLDDLDRYEVEELSSSDGEDLTTSMFSTEVKKRTPKD